MKVEGWLFGFFAIFFIPVTVVYWHMSGDWTGATLLVLSIGMAFLIGYYLLFTARRLQARPEDRPDADISEGSGEVGFFPPYSWWPIALAGAFATMVVGLVIGPFMVIIGAAFLVVAALGFLFEYYLGMNRSQAHTVGALQAMGEKPTSVRKFLGE